MPERKGDFFRWENRNVLTLSYTLLVRTLWWSVNELTNELISFLDPRFKSSASVSYTHTHTYTHINCPGVCVRTQRNQFIAERERVPVAVSNDLNRAKKEVFTAVVFFK